MAGFRVTARELARRLGGRVEGDGEVVLTGAAALDAAGPEQVTFVLDARRTSALATSKAGAAIVAEDAPAAGMTLIRVKNVQAAVAGMLGIIGDNESLPPPGVHPSAVVAEDARLGEGVAVGAGAVVEPGAELAAGVVVCAKAVVGRDVTIGEHTVIFEHTVLQGRCRIGRRCRVGPGAVIGSSGYGYFVEDGRHRRVPHTGSVEIGDDVDIGACSCVDRGKFGATRIGDGTKIDNLVQVAHNVQIGRGCLLAGQVGIAGSAVLKDFVVLGGHTGVRDNITVGAGVQAAAFAAIAQDVPDGATIAGIPAGDARQQLRAIQMTAKLPELRQQLRQLVKRLEALESAADHKGTG